MTDIIRAEPAAAIVRLYYFAQLPYNEIDGAAAASFILLPNEAGIGRHFSDAAIDTRRTRTRWNWELMVAQVNAAMAPIPQSIAIPVLHVPVSPYDSDDSMPALADQSDVDYDFYDYDSDDSSDDGMPPLLDNWESDSGYGSA
ncbi:hypothetical protein C8J56DRAFT_900340 [Mycena floridula]|nr:hypothetical protein C8J56DRAFT_900340 [Mycena floridula]